MYDETKKERDERKHVMVKRLLYYFYYMDGRSPNNRIYYIAVMKVCMNITV